ncbi:MULTISPECIES: hypothetical protein [unclassified Halomonas]|mgnify:CR=1 FL=1|jgi:hypothetical protein|uniref:hypothetical protein n=1 Tax=unclassified Halomonas TaxID=2609666 RepID=UPI003B94161A
MGMKRARELMLRAMLDVVDRSAATMSAACLVAALLGTVIRPDKQATAYAGSVLFFLLACAASTIKAMLDMDTEEES